MHKPAVLLEAAVHKLAALLEAAEYKLAALLEAAVRKPAAVAVAAVPVVVPVGLRRKHKMQKHLHSADRNLDRISYNIPFPFDYIHCQIYLTLYRNNTVCIIS